MNFISDMCMMYGVHIAKSKCISGTIKMCKVYNKRELRLKWLWQGKISVVCINC